MLIKHLADHVVKSSPTCGEIHEILCGNEFSPNVALAFDIGPTKAHFHTTFDEIYFVLDGSIRLTLFDPATGQVTHQDLAANELCVITRGIHHRVTAASPANRLCVITTPQFSAGDEQLSSEI